MADKAKKQKVGEPEFDEDAILASVEKLQDFQHQLSKINEEASDEVLAIEQKYITVRKPLYEKRSEVIRTIPDFWLTAFMSHPVLGDLLTEEDQQIFSHLSSIGVDDCTDVKSGYSISFVFKPNPYFEDTKLTKSFTFLDEGIAKITATNIEWKEGKGIPNGVADEKKGNKRPPADESFFTWFSEAEFKSDIDEFQDEVSDIIKDELWSNPLAFFNNEADEEDFEEEENDEEDDGSDSQEEDGEEDE